MTEKEFAETILKEICAFRAEMTRTLGAFVVDVSQNQVDPVRLAEMRVLDAACACRETTWRDVRPDVKPETVGEWLRDGGPSFDVKLNMLVSAVDALNELREKDE